MSEAPSADARELGRLMRGLGYVCRGLVKIRQKIRNKVVPLELNRVQCWVEWNMEDMRRLGLPVRLWILKGRQFGITTLGMAYLWHRARIFGELCLLLAHKELAGRRMMDKVELIEDKAPSSVTFKSHVQPLSPPAEGGIKGTLMKWKNGGLILRESAESEDPGVSMNFQHVWLTEPPLWKNRQGQNRGESIMGGLLPTIPHDPSTTIVGEFTARGVGDYTHTTFEEARKGASPFRALFLAWYWHEEYVHPFDPAVDAPLSREEREYRDYVKSQGFAYPLTAKGAVKKAFADKDLSSLETLRVGFDLSMEQMMFRRLRIAGYKGDLDYWKREYPATPEEAFSSSGRRLIASSVMDKMDRHMRPPVRRGEMEVRIVKGRRLAKFVEREDGRLWQWDRPEPARVYLIDADAASGMGRDFHAMHVLRLGVYDCEVCKGQHRIKCVASWQGKGERPHEFARLLSRLGRAYRSRMEVDRSGLIVPGSGRPALIVPERNGFGEHVITELTENLRPPYRNVYRHEERNQDLKVIGHRYGFPTTYATKMPMLQMLVQVCFDEDLECPCSRTLGELRNMIYLDEDDKQAGAPDGAHDDLGMSIGIGAKIAMTKGAVKYGAESTQTY